VAPVRIVPVLGEIETPFATGAATVTVVVADFVVSATLVAVTVTFPAAAGAVKRPLAVIVPPVADQVTDLSVTVPCTFAVNCCVAPVRMDGAAGEIEMELTTGGAGALTVMMAVADLVVSATLVAVIVAVPEVAAAVKSPDALIVPDEVFHVTDLLAALPCTAAVSCSVAAVFTEPLAGETETEDTAGAAAEMVTVAEADFVGSATLVAVMTAAPVFAGAVKRPAEEIVPVEAVQVTAVLVAVP
jgi:hypothetical protein